MELKRNKTNIARQIGVHMRVIAGTAKRLHLKTAPGVDIRPTTDRIKETLFNMIHPDLYDCRFLDLFSGSGAIGIEALSRGAKYAVFVENNRNAVACIKENLAFTGLKEQAKVMSGDVLSSLVSLEGSEAFDFIFLDPPYHMEYEKKVLQYLKDSTLVDKDTMIIVEASLTTAFDYVELYGFTIHKRKEYKTNVHVFIKKFEEE